MLEQGREGERRPRGPFEADKDQGGTAPSYDELTERYTTGRELRAVVAREGAGARYDARSTWFSDDPGTE